MQSGRRNRASGLILVLAVLAMLAIMATTFITLMRLDVRITANYVDDQRCELLARGMMSYLAGLMREDQDRTWGRYENRDMAVGVAATYGLSEYVSIPGIEGASWGTPACNDVWYSAPEAVNWGGWGNLYDVDTAYGLMTQESFLWNDYYNRQHGVIARYERNIGGRLIEVDAFVDRIRNCWAQSNSQGIRFVDKYHHLHGPGVDDDGDGIPNAQWGVGDMSNAWYTSPYGLEQNADSWWYYDQPAAVICSRNQAMFPGRPFTGEAALPGGLFWRWSLNVGYGHSMYVNLNTAGNVFKHDDYLQNIGGIGLEAKKSYEDEVVSGEHLGRMEWKGFAQEYDWGRGGFHKYYDAVAFHPSQVNLERLFWRPPPFTDGPVRNVNVDPAKAAAIVRARWPSGRPADGADRWCVGWRRDGATYYRLPSPENPLGSDRYFGMTEVLEHDRATYNGASSALANLLTPTEQRRIRPFTTCWSTDTILRGKIWPNEGWLPWRNNGQPGGAAGDWRHIDILKRVNINMLGAKGPEGLPGEDSTLKTCWAAKSARERDRLYFMLVHAMEFSNLPAADLARKHLACQFVASLTDMVDRDHNESYYPAPDGSGEWALGVEKHPVINEVMFYTNGDARTASYSLYRMRVELYNPAENIPWIPDADEAYDVNDYVLTLGTHAYRLGDLDKYLTDLNASQGRIDNAGNRRIGADGLYGVPIAGWVSTDPPNPTWTRFLHIGWNNSDPSVGIDWPAGLTRSELEGGAGFSGIKISLWKPLSDRAEDGNPAGNVAQSPGRIETLTVGGASRRYLCVDTTGDVKLIRPYDPARGEAGPGVIANDTNWDPTHVNPDTALNRSEARYIGLYRRWDPMNAKIYVAPTPPGESQVGKDDRCQVLWCLGWTPPLIATLGRPNIDYRAKPYSNPSTSSTGISASKYQRQFEKNFKVVDGDLPSIGWLGELILKNAAQDGPLPWIHDNAQNPASSTSANLLDVIKFDLYNPFNASGDPRNLHVLDCFTVWDPSNDGIDNDGDGAVDDDDTGRQPGDRCGPEIRVFGRLDLNYASHAAFQAAFPDLSSLDSRWDWRINKQAPNAGIANGGSRQSERGGGGGEYGGVFETIGDLLRTDSLSSHPGSHMGFLSTVGNVDDDGDGITNERDERDMIFSWVSNYFTTRANVFEMDMTVDIGPPPFYPNRKLPMPAYKSRPPYARKQIVGVLDRSTTLRIEPDGSCDFTAPVDLRMLRFTDDVRVY